MQSKPVIRLPFAYKYPLYWSHLPNGKSGKSGMPIWHMNGSVISTSVTLHSAVPSWMFLTQQSKTVFNGSKHMPQLTFLFCHTITPLKIRGVPESNRLNHSPHGYILAGNAASLSGFFSYPMSKNSFQASAFPLLASIAE